MQMNAFLLWYVEAFFSHSTFFLLFLLFFSVETEVEIIRACLLTGHVKAATYPGVGGQGSTWQRVAI